MMIETTSNFACTGNKRLMHCMFASISIHSSGLCLILEKITGSFITMLDGR